VRWPSLPSISAGPHQPPSEMTRRFIIFFLRVLVCQSVMLSWRAYLCSFEREWKAAPQTQASGGFGGETHKEAPVAPSRETHTHKVRAFFWFCVFCVRGVSSISLRRNGGIF
jgi:hypothetical protein